MCRFFRFSRLVTLMLFMGAMIPAWAADEVTRNQIKGLGEQVPDIKKDAPNLTSELPLLEEKLLFPSNNQVSFFVSMYRNDAFRLDSVQLKLNDKIVAQHLYTFRERESLQQGDLQRLYTGNIKTGEHSLVVSFMGMASAGGEYKHSATYTVVKEAGPKFVEIKIAGPGAAEQGVKFRDW